MRKVVLYKFGVEWKVYDRVGNEIDKNSKLFTTEPKAKAFATDLKQRTPREQNVAIVIRELETDEIVERFKKRAGNVNFKRN